MQGDTKHGDRPDGKLYATLPPGGIPLRDGTWIEEGSLLQLNAAVYGLVNAPSAWRKSIVSALEDLGYRRSCYCPCTFVDMTKHGPNGHVLLEVDDIASQGNSIHDEKMRSLRNKFKFGKWTSVYGSEAMT